MKKKSKKSFIDKLLHLAQWHKWIIMISAFLLYANTLGYDYTQDDAIVIKQNVFTQQGFAGIGGILSKDTFYGFFQSDAKTNLVSGGRYRPLSLVMFAIEYQIFGDKPWVGHCINVLLYALLGLVIYLWMTRLFLSVVKPEKLALLAFLITMLYIWHPVHTEAVANIKGRDEILAMLLGSLGTYLALGNNRGKLWKYGISSVLIFLACLAKENAILFIPVLGMSYWVVKGESFSHSVRQSLPFLGAALLFLIVRYQVLGWSVGEQPMEMMNNPFVKYENGNYTFFTTGEKWATILYGMGEYVRLLLFPHPLTSDYYPRQIGVMHFGDPGVWVSLLVYVAIIGASIYAFAKNKIIFFGLAFYLLTILLYANILFPIGTHISERFLFMPSLGFAIVLAYLLQFIYYKKISYVFYIFALVLFLGYGTKTMARNMVWENNYTLFTTDVKTSNNSAKALNAAGGILTDTAIELQDVHAKQERLRQAVNYLNKALEIHPAYKNAWLIKGNAQFYLDDKEGAIHSYERALSLDGEYADARKNLAVTLRIVGRETGEKKQDARTAKEYFLRAYQLNPSDNETIRLLGIAEGFLGNHQEALKYFQRYTQLAPQEAVGYVLQSQSYANLGNQQKATEFRQKALQLDPNAYGQK